jgi:hypothetical protein
MTTDKSRVATVVTVLIVATVLLWAVIGRRQEAPEPGSVVWTMIEAAQAGEVERYLDCFAAGLRQRLEATAAEMSTDGFSEYLRSSSQLLTGVAVYDVEQPQPGRASLTVEYVYRDATERQQMQLELARGSWTITDLERSRRSKPLIPYGAPAAPMPEPAEGESDQAEQGPSPTGEQTP